ncbi:hypothetical protein AXF42_Ash011821 [Apostasia shenzhenica]|uniref:Uncharacterized protein n=1 Tax=Apostasia shenzhenica TaxID=1088818 RepID=A0A2I0AVX9_9ASPA|nr:hypothetical protein AXF42_Ash011821 [Apostasia shenzhenica]
MANRCAIQQNAFSTADDRLVICPKPRRLCAAIAAVRPFRWQNPQTVDCPDAKSLGNELLDILLAKGSGEQIQHSDPLHPFFCGSPPTRFGNPVVRDTRFGHTVPLVPAAASPATGSQVRYGPAPPAVRVEGFDCLDHGRRRSRGVPAIA